MQAESDISPISMSDLSQWEKLNFRLLLTSSLRTCFPFRTTSATLCTRIWGDFLSFFITVKLRAKHCLRVKSHRGTPAASLHFIVFLSTSLFAAYFVKLCKYFSSRMQHRNAIESECACFGFLPPPNYDSKPIVAVNHHQNLWAKHFQHISTVRSRLLPNPQRALILACSEPGKPPLQSRFKAYNTNSPKSRFVVILIEPEDPGFPVMSFG